MRVLHVFDHSLPLHSGYTFRSVSILREQRALGWETLHLTGGKQGSGALLQEQVDDWLFYRTPDSRGLMSHLPVLNQWALVRDLERRLLSLAQALRPDVIHAHSPALNGVPAVRVGRRLGIPVVYETRAFWEDAAVDHGTTTEGSVRYRLTRAMETWVFRRADATTTICEGLRDDIVARGIPAERVTIIPNAVDAARFTVSTVRDAELEIALGLDGKTVLGFLGSFYGYEGLRLLIDALPGLIQRDPAIRVLLVGGGFQEDSLKQQALDLGVADKVIFTGRVPHAVVDRYYSLVDILVYPRLSMRLTETVTPLKPLEAMAQGKLLIASDVGGHRELIRDGETGMLFKAGDSQALAECVWHLLDARDQWDRIRENGRRFVDTERNWRNSVARYVTVYADAQERAGRR
ncbi:MAG: glycosyltransferase, exosortase A system-associated [Gammaproteobacteria bacterium]|nr:glycosyltransferase, exosortase A system-associated [Gammaproteobacteria bacterium]MCP5135196.1 glycosyltransferase, exosortase A system-associated [Gammaproteobacteria bacterium]